MPILQLTLNCWHNWKFNTSQSLKNCICRPFNAFSPSSGLDSNLTTLLTCLWHHRLHRTATSCSLLHRYSSSPLQLWPSLLFDINQWTSAGTSPRLRFKISDIRWSTERMIRTVWTRLNVTDVHLYENSSGLNVTSQPFSPLQLL